MNKFTCLLAVLLPAAASAAPDRTAIVLPGAAADGPGAVATTTRSAAPPAWPQLAPEQQRERRSHYASWRALSEAERQRVREAAARFAALPPAQQQDLRSQFQAQDQAFRDGWRLGPLLGEHFGRLQGLFGFLPPEQRAPALAVLRQLSREQVAQLALVAQRTPPQQRDSVRAAFLAVAPGERDRWLQEQAGR